MEAEDGAREERPGPSRGGSEGYDIHHREEILQLVENGLPHGASRSSVWRWRQRMQRQEKKGGPTARNFVGIDLLLLAMYRVAYPKCTATEIIAFMARTSPRAHITGLYNASAVSRAEAKLGLTRKKGSTTAYKAFTPANIIRRRLYWTEGWPYGVAGIPRRDLIDIDEAAFTLEQLANRTYGKSPARFRVRAPGHYG